MAEKSSSTRGSLTPGDRIADLQRLLRYDQRLAGTRSGRRPSATGEGTGRTVTFRAWDRSAGRRGGWILQRTRIRSPDAAAAGSLPNSQVRTGVIASRWRDIARPGQNAPGLSGVEPNVVSSTKRDELAQKKSYRVARRGAGETTSIPANQTDLVSSMHRKHRSPVGQPRALHGACPLRVAFHGQPQFHRIHYLVVPELFYFTFGLTLLTLVHELICLYLSSNCCVRAH